MSFEEEQLEWKGKLIRRREWKFRVSPDDDDEDLGETSKKNHSWRDNNSDDHNPRNKGRESDWGLG